MKSRVGLTFGFSLVLLCAMLLSLVYIQGAVSHYNVKKVTDVIETCYLIGHPSRTECQELSFTETTYTLSGDDHMAILNANNQLEIVHKPGRANHAQDDKPKTRERRTRLVYNNCGECN